VIDVPPDLAASPGVVGVGIDVVDIDRLRTALARTPRLAERVFTATERAQAQRRADPTSAYASRFAAKEATLKALGLGLFELPLDQIEVVGGGDAAPALRLGPDAATAAASRGIDRWLVSLTHDARLAAAIVVGLAGS
jgi:holo-[acyl-carrier protein] synthase